MGGNMVFQGRILKKYIQKKIIFLLLVNEDERLRCIIKDGEHIKFEKTKEQCKIGNIVCVEGDVQCGKDGHRELLAKQVNVVVETRLASFETGMLEESKFQGVKARQYYHTMMLTDMDSICYMKSRSAIIQCIHAFFAEKDFCNLSTPVLQHNFYAGGARPFVTHMLDSNCDMYLRITSEIAMKLLNAGGLSKIYEVGDYFRNGSVNEMHSVPFSALEAYQTYISYEEMQNLANELLGRISESVSLVFQKYGKQSRLFLDGKIPECSFDEFIRQAGYSEFRIEDLETYPDVPELRDKSEDAVKNAKVLYKWLKETLIRKQKSPIWISDLPVGQSPLIKKKDEYRLFRKYLIVNGATLAEITQSETNVDILRENLELQQNDQNHRYPHDYAPLFHAYSLGIPEVCSMFLSIDRLYPAFAGKNSIQSYKMYI